MVEQHLASTDAPVKRYNAMPKNRVEAFFCLDLETEGKRSRTQEDPLDESALRPNCRTETSAITDSSSMKIWNSLRNLYTLLDPTNFTKKYKHWLEQNEEPP